MDYHFSINEYQQPQAWFSMGNEAIAQWFNEEMGNDIKSTQKILDIISQLKNKTLQEKNVQGKEFELKLDQYEVEVIAMHLHFDDPQELPEDTEFYDEESMSGCGLEDFEQALKDWLAFIS